MKRKYFFIKTLIKFLVENKSLKRNSETNMLKINKVSFKSLNHEFGWLLIFKRYSVRAK